MSLGSARDLVHTILGATPGARKHQSGCPTPFVAAVMFPASVILLESEGRGRHGSSARTVLLVKQIALDPMVRQPWRQDLGGEPPRGRRGVSSSPCRSPERGRRESEAYQGCQRRDVDFVVAWHCA